MLWKKLAYESLCYQIGAQLENMKFARADQRVWILFCQSPRTRRTSQRLYPIFDEVLPALTFLAEFHFKLGNMASKTTIKLLASRRSDPDINEAVHLVLGTHHYSYDFTSDL